MEIPTEKKQLEAALVQSQKNPGELDELMKQVEEKFQETEDADPKVKSAIMGIMAQMKEQVSDSQNSAGQTTEKLSKEDFIAQAKQHQADLPAVDSDEQDVRIAQVQQLLEKKYQQEQQQIQNVLQQETMTETRRIWEQQKNMAEEVRMARMAQQAKLAALRS